MVYHPRTSGIVMLNKSQSSLGVFALLVSAMLLASCGRVSSDREAGEGRVRVVATFSILGDLVAEVGGEWIDLTVLAGPDRDVHTYDPMPRDSVALAGADVVFAQGLGFEPWLDGMFSASGSDARRVTVTDTIKPRHAEEDEHGDDHAGHHHDSASGGGGHGSGGEADPHAWHDVRNVIAMVRTIAEALSEADPDHAAAFAANRDRYISELEALDTYIVQRVGELPPEKRKLVTTHDAFGYFAERYGFEVISVQGKFSTASGDPSAAEMAAVIDRIKAMGVKAVFVENMLSPKLTQRLAEQAGASVVATLYSDSLGPPASDGGSYLQMMRHNTDAVVEALQ